MTVWSREKTAGSAMVSEDSFSATSACLLDCNKIRKTGQVLDVHVVLCASGVFIDRDPGLDVQMDLGRHAYENLPHAICFCRMASSNRVRLEEYLPHTTCIVISASWR